MKAQFGLLPDLMDLCADAGLRLEPTVGTATSIANVRWYVRPCDVTASICRSLRIRAFPDADKPIFPTKEARHVRRRK